MLTSCISKGVDSLLSYLCIMKGVDTFSFYIILKRVLAYCTAQCMRLEKGFVACWFMHVGSAKL